MDSSNFNYKEIKSGTERLIEARLRVGRSSEFIADREDVRVQLVEEIQDAYWEEYALTLV